MGYVENSGIAITLKKANISTSFDVRSVQYNRENELVSASLFVTYVENTFYTQSGSLPSSEEYENMLTSIPPNFDGEGYLPPSEWTEEQQGAVLAKYDSWVTAQPAEYSSIGGDANPYATIVLPYEEFTTTDAYPNGPVEPSGSVTTLVSQETKTCKVDVLAEEGAMEYEDAIDTELTRLL
ncbi:MAG: hypothetical protein Unbinned2903contig1001_31 [Prokaryotic dsDNA virus sp.]|nr:MAG: hypothetical protein Unbinned2903contig1001_31 [Prokaryotic dsDNA virus sp.]